MKGQTDFTRQLQHQRRAYNFQTVKIQQCIFVQWLRHAWCPGMCTVHLLQNKTSADSMHRSKLLSGQIRKSILALWTCHVHLSCATSRSMTYRLSIAPTCLNGSQATRGPKFLDGTVGSCKLRMAKYRLEANANMWTTARYSY